MRIEKLHIKGFRNFRDEEFLFQPQTLIIGANDVGKTNLLYALRLLFDKSLNEHDLELTDSDYNVYSGTEYIEITVTISEINNSNPKTLLSKLIEERENYYKSLVDKNPKLKKFLNGWLNRINETNKYINNLKEED